MKDKIEISWVWGPISGLVAGVVGLCILMPLTRAFPVLKTDRIFGWIAGLTVGPLVVATLLFARWRERKKEH